MLGAADNELLTRTGPNTDMGRYFRCFWMPIALSRELPDCDGAPIKVKVLEEDLIAFRATDGRVGLVEPTCPHRGANLFFGRNEDCAIRCVYHGWKFDLEGNAIEMPNVPHDAKYHGAMRIKAYPTREFAEMVWAWMGPLPSSSSELPPLPALEVGLVPPEHRFVSKKLQQCNWAQSIEGALDTAHFSFLHMPAPKVAATSNPNANADQKRLQWMRDDPMPQFSFVDHDAGFVAGASRRADDDELYWRISQFLTPNHSLAPNALPGENYQGQTWVPISDTECWIYTYAWNPLRELTSIERNKLESGHGVIGETGPDFIPLSNRNNDYRINRQDQKHKTFTGVNGVSEQDAMIQDSQGLIADRTLEHLTPTDAAVVRFRRVVLKGARELAGGVLPNVATNSEAYCVRSGSTIAAENMTFANVMLQRFNNPIGQVLTAKEKRIQ